MMLCCAVSVPCAGCAVFRPELGASCAWRDKLRAVPLLAVMIVPYSVILLILYYIFRRHLLRGRGGPCAAATDGDKRNFFCRCSVCMLLIFLLSI